MFVRERRRRLFPTGLLCGQRMDIDGRRGFRGKQKKRNTLDNVISGGFFCEKRELTGLV